MGIALMDDRLRLQRVRRTDLSAFFLLTAEEEIKLTTTLSCLPSCNKGVSAVVCDALDLKGVEAVLDGCDAAITTMGGAPEDDPAKRVDYAGNRNVIESAGILGITRVVMVTSVGCGSSREAISDQVYQVSIFRGYTIAQSRRNKLRDLSSVYFHRILYWCQLLILNTRTYQVLCMHKVGTTRSS